MCRHGIIERGNIGVPGEDTISYPTAAVNPVAIMLEGSFVAAKTHVEGQR
jgi:hypothetical protein